MSIKAAKIYLTKPPEIISCPECASKNLKSELRFMYLSEDIAVFRCPTINCWYPNNNYIFMHTQTQTWFYHQPITDQPCEIDTINNFDCSYFNQTIESNESAKNTTIKSKHSSTDLDGEEDYLFENDSLDIVEKSLLSDGLNINELMSDLLTMEDEQAASETTMEVQQESSKPIEKTQSKTIMNFQLIEQKLKERLLNRNGPKLHSQTSYFNCTKSFQKSKPKLNKR